MTTLAEVTPNFKAINTAPVCKSARRWREEVLRRYRYRCVGCGLWTTPLDSSVLAAHHVIFRSHCHRSYHLDPRNGVPMCHRCHRRLHGGDLKLDYRALLVSTREMCRELGLTFDVAGVPRGTLSKYFAGGS